MASTDNIRLDEGFEWIAGTATLVAARKALITPTSTNVSDYRMETTKASSGRTYQGFEGFLDAVSRGVDSFSYGATSAKEPGGRATVGVQVVMSAYGTRITIYAPDDESGAAMLNLIRATAPVAGTRSSSVDRVNATPVQIGVADLHPEVVSAALSLFESGHYYEAEFEAFKSIEHRVRQMTGLVQSGVSLMGAAFGTNNPLIDTATDPGPPGSDQREGYLALYRGVMLAIRNPKAHLPSRTLDPRDALEYLALASLLHRRLDGATLPSGTVAPAPWRAQGTLVAMPARFASRWSRSAG